MGWSVSVPPTAGYHGVGRTLNPARPVEVIELKQGATVVGQLQHADTGQPLPLAGVIVTALLDWSEGHAGHYGETIKTNTDAEGRFVFANLEPGVRYHFGVHGLAYTPVARTAPVGPDDPPLLIRAAPQ